MNRKATIFDKTFKNEAKSNFGLMNVLDPIGLFGGDPIWDADRTSKANRDAFRAQQRAEHDRRAYEQKMREDAIRQASSERAYQIRQGIKSAERSAKTKSTLMIAGVIGATVLIGGIALVLILKKKKK
jgi:hypothetical protein